MPAGQGYYRTSYPPFQPGRRRPRQLAGRGRRTSMYTKGRAPQSNPSLASMQAATKIQRAFRKKRFVPKNPISAGTEVYQCRLAKQTSALSASAGSQASGPKNSLLLQPAMFHSASTIVDSNGHQFSILGTFIKPVYGWTTKVRISFSNIANHADNKAGLLLRLHHGVVKVAMNKTAFAFSNHAAFASAAVGEANRQLFDSNVTSDFLEYVKQNRDVQVNGSWIVKPNRNNMIRVDSLVHTNTVPSTTDTISSYNTPPPKTYTINHPVPKMKTRIQKDGTSPHFPMPTYLWQPFVLLTCDQLTANSGHFDVEHSSRLYFTDN